MAAAALGIVASLFGISATTYSLVSLQQQEFGEGGDNRAALKVFVGLDVNGLSGAGGDLPDARLFNIGGQFLGMVADPGHGVKSGEERSFSVGQTEPEKNNQQAIYTLFSANNDAICISYATISMAGPGGPGNSYGFMGDFGKQCGATWFCKALDSNTAIEGADYIPDCIWIDANGDQPATGFQVNWLDMQVKDGDPRVNKTTDALPSLCDTPSFTVYKSPDPNTISYYTHPQTRSFDYRLDPVSIAQGPPSRREKRKLQRRGQFAQRFDNILIIDDIPQHTAQRLCEDQTSAGPDFVNPVDGVFCDMKSKTTYPLCDDGSVAPPTYGNGTRDKITMVPCFDIETKILSGPSVKKRQSPYMVKDWRKDRASKGLV